VALGIDRNEDSESLPAFRLAQMLQIVSECLLTGNDFRDGTHGKDSSRICTI